MMRKRSVFLIILATLVLSAGALGKNSGRGGDKPASALDRATADLIGATRQYRASVEALLPIYERALRTARESCEKQRGLYADGIASKRDLEASERAVTEAQAQFDEVRDRITESDQLLAEAAAERETEKRKPDPAPRQIGQARYRTTDAVLRSSGSGAWTLARAAQVQSFFTATFGRQLPVSAFGQSATHNRMGFDHRNSMDVALHPDSPEGKALVAYLRSNGIPFLAFRGAVTGAATGAHIHVGYPSHRL